MKNLYKSLLAVSAILVLSLAALAQTQPSTTSVNDLDATEVGIYSSEGVAIVKNAEGATVSVYSVTGAEVTTIEASSDVEVIELETGIYIIQVAGEKTQKVLVK